MTTNIHIAENDPSGNRCGKVTTICFYHADGQEVRFSTFPNLAGMDIQHSSIAALKELRIGIGKSQKMYTRFGCTMWVGNNQFNAYSVTIATALQMMKDLYASDEWGWDDRLCDIEEKLKTNTLTAFDMGWVLENGESPSEVGPNQLNLFEQ